MNAHALVGLVKKALFIAFVMLMVTGVAEATELNARGHTYTVKILSDRDAPLQSYFGEYAFPYEATEGTVLHLFPNGVFVISSWFDIAPTEFVASGKYAIEDGVLKLNVSRLKSGAEGEVKRFLGLRVVSGFIQEQGYATDEQVFLVSESEWKKATHGERDVDVLQRRTAYPDWERIEHDLQQ